MCEQTINFSGVIENVMETWPLQITVTGKTETLHFILQENSKVKNKNQKYNPNQLRPGMRITLHGMQSTDGQPRVDLIEILSIETEPVPQQNPVSDASQGEAINEEELLSSPSVPMSPPQKP